MASTQMRNALKSAAGALGVLTGAYASYVGMTWLRYGHPAPAGADDVDPLLDQFMPVCEVAERHHIRIAAPAEVTFAAACEQDLMALPVARAIFKAREVLLGSQPAKGTALDISSEPSAGCQSLLARFARLGPLCGSRRVRNSRNEPHSGPDSAAHPRGLLALTKSLGWGVLAEVPGREVVMGAVTQPWKANVVFRSLPPHEFAAFDEPDYVKIVWTLRADPIGADASIFRTETRAVATDSTARAKFRRYWSFLSPGIILIRWASLNPLRADAERRRRPA